MIVILHQTQIRLINQGNNFQKVQIPTSSKMGIHINLPAVNVNLTLGFFFFISEKNMNYITQRDELNKIRLSRFKMEKYLSVLIASNVYFII